MTFQAISLNNEEGGHLCTSLLATPDLIRNCDFASCGLAIKYCFDFFNNAFWSFFEHYPPLFHLFYSDSPFLAKIWAEDCRPFDLSLYGTSGFLHAECFLFNSVYAKPMLSADRFPSGICSRCSRCISGIGTWGAKITEPQPPTTLLRNIIV